MSRWSGPGNILFRQHLQQIVDGKLSIRLVLATSSDPAGVDRGEDASKFSNTFAERPKLVGKLERFDGDAFRIRFAVV